MDFKKKVKDSTSNGLRNKHTNLVTNMSDKEDKPKRIKYRVQVFTTNKLVRLTYIGENNASTLNDIKEDVLKSVANCTDILIFTFE